MSTVGLELEWADVDRWSEIPAHLGSWNTEDYSIVNSDGHANSPDGSTWRWGGEINTRPTESVGSQRLIVEELVRLLNPTVNFKCNLHVHVQPDFNLLQDLERLKRVAIILRTAEKFVFSTVDPMPRPVDASELKRWRRNLKSHHGSVPEARFHEMMCAGTVQEFKDAHAPPTKTGGRAWHVVSRTGMNLRSLWKHETIEFRHFFGTVDPEEIASAAKWCKEFLDHVVFQSLSEDFQEGDMIARMIHETCGPWRFPRAQPYDHELALGFERTRWKK